jgi:hypothetical protein
MKRFGLILTCILATACASAGARAERRALEARLELWGQAQAAVAAGEFGRADTLYGTLIRDHGSTQQGREALFYLGALRLDPRNPNWSSALAQTSLEMYLAADSSGAIRARRPEAQTLFELARQLNLPPENRVPGLQTEPRVVERRVVVPAREATSLQAEVTRLRGEVAAKDATIKRQEEELDRIRRTLSAPGR